MKQGMESVNKRMINVTTYVTKKKDYIVVETPV